MFRARATWVRFSKPSKPVATSPFCTATTNSNNAGKSTCNNNSNFGENKVVESTSGSYNEAYKQLDKLDFTTAAKILFTDPPKTKKFGIDFHLVQFFFACMPSLAVYLVAQYARHEMRRMDAELEKKKKQEEEDKAKEMELKAIEGKETESVPELLEVKVRLDKLEEAVKGIVVETKKQSEDGVAKNQEDRTAKKDPGTTEPTNSKNRSEPSNIVGRDHLNKQFSVSTRPGLGQESASGSAPVRDASLQDQKGKTQSGGVSKGART